MFRTSSTPTRSHSHSRYSSRDDPSTTPAGPPPDKSFGPSSTPAGPPPAMGSLFGTTRPNFAPNPDFGFSNVMFPSSPPKHGQLGQLEGFGLGSIGTSNTGRPAAQRGRTTSASGFGAGFSVPTSSPSPDDDDDGDDDAEGEDDLQHYDDDDDDNQDYGSEEEDALSAQRRAKTHSRFSQSAMSRTSASELDPGPSLVKAGAKQTNFDLLAIAKGLAPHMSRVSLQESDHVILETERLVQQVHDSLNSDTPEQRTEVLGQVAQELVGLWHAAGKSKGGMASSQPSPATNLGATSKLANLLLTLHHPPPVAPSQPTSALSTAPTRPQSRHFKPIPKSLLDWLNATYPDVSEVQLVLKETHGYSRHPSYWEAVQAAAVRGNFTQCLQLLQGANLEFAATAQEDGLGNTGYSASHLLHANDAVRAAINLLRECPALASEDWDIKGHDWTIFRQRVQQAYNTLQDFAEGDSASRHAMTQSFTASHFGISQSQANFGLSVASRKAESRVPWSVYENLQRLYKLLAGDEEEILNISADWIEAVLTLTIWWTGEEEEADLGSLAASRRSIMRNQRVRSVDVTPIKAYAQRLSASLAMVIANSDEDFSVNVTDRFEVGLACIIDDNMEGILHILCGWSLPVAAAVAELASAGEWLARANGIMDQFDQSDLMVLSYTEQQQHTGASKDDFLIAYAKLLAVKGQLKDQQGQPSKEGWELAIQVLGRLDDSITASGRIEQILNDLPLESSVRVDKITRLCHELGLSQHALTVAQKYADHLRANTQNYGDTLLYYARAHDTLKMQEVVRVLVAHCLVKSIAYPPPSEMDESLNSLITSPKQTLTKLASLDSEAATMLSNHLSGYATMRKFYDLRDEEVVLKLGEKPTRRPLARKLAAANALSVIIASASSSIRGGLYDPEIETVVPVDLLLPLLGEALVFVGQPKRILTLRQLYSLLAAIEDLETAPSMIRNQCEEVLSTTLSAAHDSQPDLQKSTSNLTTASSQFSLIDFGSTDAQTTENSTLLLAKGGEIDQSKRGWDWRCGVPKAANGALIIKILRLRVAREIARAFAEGEVST